MRKRISIKFDSYRRGKGDDPLCLSVIYLQFISFFPSAHFLFVLFERFVTNLKVKQILIRHKYTPQMRSSNWRMSSAGQEIKKIKNKKVFEKTNKQRKTKQNQTKQTN